MAQDRDRDGRGRRDDFGSDDMRFSSRGQGGYGYGEDRRGHRGDRDWTDRAGDEMRSWFGDDEAERRRRMDEQRGYGDRGSGGDYGYGGYADRGPSVAGSAAYGYGAMYGGSDYGERSRSGRGSYGYGQGDYGQGGYGQRGGMHQQGGYGSGGYGKDYSGFSHPGDRGFLERAGDEVASWFGDRDAERRREQDHHRGRGPKGYSRSDDRIREDVNDRLTDDWALDASDIEITVSNREVTLSGEVMSREDKRRAEDIAESVSGVAHVQNNLRVKGRMGASATGGSTMGGGMTGQSGGATTVVTEGSAAGTSSSTQSGSRRSTGTTGS
ncbi:MAG TPA: SWFGD domain-containing protein [Mesorhizobium sp.]|jgi:osmotically-inducible protein OsmY|nr:SWFGD domain-containing protein [Mesorhizobium sp.]